VKHASEPSGSLPEPCHEQQKVSVVADGYHSYPADSYYVYDRNPSSRLVWRSPKSVSSAAVKQRRANGRRARPTGIYMILSSIFSRTLSGSETNGSSLTIITQGSSRLLRNKPSADINQSDPSKGETKATAEIQAYSNRQLPNLRTQSRDRRKESSPYETRPSRSPHSWAFHNYSHSHSANCRHLRHRVA
jgi:hypothetical protein